MHDELAPVSIVARPGARVRDRRRMVPCDECATPVAELRPGGLVIKSRHHNEWHVTIIPLAQIRVWLDTLDA